MGLDQYKMSGKDFLEGLFDRQVVDYNNPSCNNCADCCTATAMLTETEYKSLKKFLSKDNEGRKIYRESVERVKRIERETGCINMMCPFMNDRSKKCSIYSRRPRICRDFHCTTKLQGEGFEEFKRELEDAENHYMIYNLFNKK